MQSGARPFAACTVLLVNSMTRSGSTDIQCRVSIQCGNPLPRKTARQPNSLIFRLWWLLASPAVGVSRTASARWIWRRSASSPYLKPRGCGAHRSSPSPIGRPPVSTGPGSGAHPNWQSGKWLGAAAQRIIHPPSNHVSFFQHLLAHPEIVFIVAYQDQELVAGATPAESDIAGHFLVSAASVNQMVHTLERRGLIEWKRR